MTLVENNNNISAAASYIFNRAATFYRKQGQH